MRIVLAWLAYWWDDIRETLAGLLTLLFIIVLMGNVFGFWAVAGMGDPAPW